MTLRILRDSFLRQKRRKAVILAAVSLGTATAAALGDIALDVGDKMNRELKGFGANLTLIPRAGGAPVVVGGEDVSGLRVPATLAEDDVPRAKDNFWKNNILAVAPILDVPARATVPDVREVAGDAAAVREEAVVGTGAGTPVLVRGAWFERAMRLGPEPGDERFVTGLRTLNPYWKIEGDWPAEPGVHAHEGQAGGESLSAGPSVEIVVGRRLADALGVGPGSTLALTSGARVIARVAGVLTTGGDEDLLVLAPIEVAWSLSGLTGRVARIEIAALTTPETAVYERLGKNPKDLPPAEFEKWTCTPFVSSIAYELERAVPGAEARVVRRIAETEGRILKRTSSLMLLIAAMAGLGAALTVTSALTTSVLERRGEIGLLKAMGAGNARVVGLFLAEAAGLGVLGGLIGAAAGAVMARWISAAVFGSPVSVRPLSIPLAVAAALAITSLGCVLPARRILSFRPFEVLRGL